MFSTFIWQLIGVTLLFTLITTLIRFSAPGRVRSGEKDLSKFGKYTGGFHIHHSIFGLALVAVTYFLVDDPQLRHLFLLAGWGLVFSDLIAHFVVANLTSGDHEFSIFYPGEKEKILKNVRSHEGINVSMFDRFSFAHFFVGLLLGLTPLSYQEIFVIAVVWEVVEYPLKKALPGWFPAPSHDSLRNSIGDVIAWMAGAFLVRLLLGMGFRI